MGFFWTAKDTGCPAVLRTATGACGGPLNNSGEPGFNFTGNSRYAGSEVDVGFRYTIMPGLVRTPRFGYAFLGGAFDTNNRSSQNAWVLANRMIYLF